MIGFRDDGRESLPPRFPGFAEQADMRTIIRIACVLIVVAFVVVSATARQTGSNYASDAEINLLMGQADRGMKQYEQIVAQEKKLLGENVDTATDAKLFDAWRAVKGALDKDPQKYNSFAGFDIVAMLDDASRNVALVSNSAATELLQQLTGGKVSSKSDSLVTLMQSANSTGTLLYTVAESAAALYLRYLHWQNDTFNEAVTELTKCAAMLKKPK
jgi:hypothetical protein